MLFLTHFKSTSALSSPGSTLRLFANKLPHAVSLCDRSIGDMCACACVHMCVLSPQIDRKHPEGICSFDSVLLKRGNVIGQRDLMI